MNGNIMIEILLKKIIHAKWKLSMIPGHREKAIGVVRIKSYSFDVSNCFSIVRYTVTIAPGMQGSVQAWKIYVV
jgi:hypothetical protein